MRVYDRGFDFTEPANFGEYQLTYRSGDMVVPRLDASRAAGPRARGLRARDPRPASTPRSHAGSGVEIVRVLEAAHASLDSSGEPVELGTAAAR